MAGKHLEAALNSYTQGLSQVGLEPTGRVVEFLIWMGEDVEQIAPWENGRIRLSTRGLNLAAESMGGDAPAEIAFVSHASRQWQSWFPGLVT